jgi:hypothetical protein
MIKLNLQYFGGSGAGIGGASGGSTRVTASSYSGLLTELESQGYQVDAAYRRRASGDDEIILYRNGQQYTATYNVYSDGGTEVTRIRRS